MMGITYVFGDNQSVLANTTAPDSTLKKKSNAIAYHFIREGCARVEWRTTYINTDKNVADLLTKPLAGPKRTRFVWMLLHHYVWWGRGEDYDKFEGIQTSTCLSFESKLTMIFVFFMISQWGIWVWWFPNVTQWGLGIFYIDAEWGRLYWFGFGVQSKWERNFRIGLRGVFNGTVLYALLLTIWLWVRMG